MWTQRVDALAAPHLPRATIARGQSKGYPRGRFLRSLPPGVPAEATTGVSLARDRNRRKDT